MAHVDIRQYICRTRSGCLSLLLMLTHLMLLRLTTHHVLHVLRRILRALPHIAVRAHVCIFARLRYTTSQPSPPQQHACLKLMSTRRDRIIWPTNKRCRKN